MRLLRTAYGMLAPGGPNGKLQVFIFHRVLDNPDPLLPNEPDIKRFEWMMQLIAENFTVLRLEDAVSRLAAGSLPRAAACITFDDGYRDNLELALPILSRHGLVATFFVATAFLGNGRMWNDDIVEAVRNLGSGRAEWNDFGLGSHPLTTQAERLRCVTSVLPVLKYFPHLDRERVARAIARQSGVADSCTLMMEPRQVQALAAAGMEIGAHTHSHPILAQLDTGEVREEILTGRAELERITGGPIRIFAYPNGDTRRDLSIRDAELIRELGFVCAVTTDRGVSDRSTNPFLMPRFTPWDRTPARFAMRCAMALSG
ncbi:MAG: polysaccharide deacetylase family protein [Rhodocyclaceae bacterium]|nr:polysaccharide deacetylase family protein [Rhodocyclaceae bacterium]